MQKTFLSVAELLDRWAVFGVTNNTLRHWREKKRHSGPGWTKIGLRILYPLESVEQYEQDQTTPSRSRRNKPALPV